MVDVYRHDLNQLNLSSKGKLILIGGYSWLKIVSLVSFYFFYKFDVVLLLFLMSQNIERM